MPSSDKRGLPKLEVRGFVGYIRYIAYLGTYDEYVRGLRRNDHLVKDNVKEGKQ
ncbi:hypothetical protein [Vulcanisaeta distributa]|uniref:Uncharacterized protein n=1 Tax=Vulcanisaeta distributa (strain DSM 14429 / JCM 11212 / NBRC 100878 / IC-017) TaxID=572478 RepID=E1QRM4_VULDI|nr:hypothetical protein [Vulcanisaeta distributa]ADN51838.1 hypothetical protein Vdis_2473 [Vulcanisaeta distributa DSM 14429]